MLDPFNAAGMYARGTSELKLNGGNQSRCFVPQVKNELSSDQHGIKYATVESAFLRETFIRKFKTAKNGKYACYLSFCVVCVTSKVQGPSDDH
jgi:hypothetical protein